MTSIQSRDHGSLVELVEPSSLTDEVARLRRYGEILADFSRMTSDATSVDRLLQFACSQAARGIGVGHTKIMRYRPETGDLLMVAGVGWKPGVVGHTVFGTDLASPPGRALQTRQLVMQHDAPNDPEFRYAPVLRDHGIASLLNAPVGVDGAIWGVLEVDSVAPRHFSADDEWFLTAFGNVLGLVLHGRTSLQRASEAEASTARALVESQTLLEELRHRSKNDLQLVLAMLVMQKRKQTDEQARRGFDHIMDRVAAIGLAHDQLAPGQDLGRVELADYLQALCGNLEQRRENIHIEARLTRAEVSHEQAVSLGLIVNELVTNALKYAFPDDRSGTIQVGFKVAPLGNGCLHVRDDGIGMGPPRPGSSGTELVNRLVQQIGGRVERHQVERGTAFAISFPLVG